jgi:hypothetical protein
MPTHHNLAKPECMRERERERERERYGDAKPNKTHHMTNTSYAKKTVSSDSLGTNACKNKNKKFPTHVVIFFS